MDPRAHRLANALVGNPADAAALEITFVGPEVEFDDERLVAVTGAEFELSVDGRAERMNSAFSVHVGSVLRCGPRRRGARACLAVAGGIAVPPVLGSRATHLPSAMGGLDGRPLKAGDRLPLGKRGRESFLDPPKRGRTPFSEAAKKGYDPFFGVGETTPVPFFTVRVLPGPQLDRFASDALEVLQSRPYTIDAASNRMGFRLTGPALKHAGAAEMLSDSIPFGAIQVPAAGQPILLMADRPTTGGYPNIATVISADIGIAGQLAPGDSISFVVTTMREAMAALIAQEQALMAFDADAGRR
jgi:antagonist of KipI